MWAGGLSKHHTFTTSEVSTGAGVGATVTCQPLNSPSKNIESVAM